MASVLAEANDASRVGEATAVVAHGHGPEPWTLSILGIFGARRAGLPPRPPLRYGLS
jgi:hypothetical protein